MSSNRNRARSPSLLVDCKLPPSAYINLEPVAPIIVDLDDSDCEEVKFVKVEPIIKTDVTSTDDEDDTSEIEFLGYREVERIKIEKPVEKDTNENVTQAQKNNGGNRSKDSVSSLPSSTSRRLQKENTQRTPLPVPPTIPESTTKSKTQSIGKVTGRSIPVEPLPKSNSETISRTNHGLPSTQSTRDSSTSRSAYVRKSPLSIPDSAPTRSTRVAPPPPIIRDILAKMATSTCLPRPSSLSNANRETSVPACVSSVPGSTTSSPSTVLQPQPIAPSAASPSESSAERSLSVSSSITAAVVRPASLPSPIPSSNQTAEDQDIQPADAEGLNNENPTTPIAATTDGHGTSTNTCSESSNSTANHHVQKKLTPEGSKSSSTPGVAIGMHFDMQKNAITVSYEGGKTKVFKEADVDVDVSIVSNVSNTPSSGKRQLVSGYCQTSDSIVNGQFIGRKPADLNLTVPASSPSQSENRAFVDSSTETTGQSILSSNRQSGDRQSEEMEMENSKDRQRNDGNSKRGGWTGRSSSCKDNYVHGDRNRHPSSDKDRRHDQYLKKQERRFSVHDADWHSIPKFKTEEELIFVIRTCFECNTASPNRREGVDHQKKEHNRKHCPVCFQLLSCMGNIWKDHLIKYHAISKKELAKCPFCRNDYSFEGMYQHIGKVHLIPKEENIVFPPTLTPETTRNPTAGPSSALGSTTIPIRNQSSKPIPQLAQKQQLQGKTVTFVPRVETAKTKERTDARLNPHKRPAAKRKDPDNISLKSLTERSSSSKQPKIVRQQYSESSRTLPQRVDVGRAEKSSSSSSSSSSDSSSESDTQTNVQSSAKSKSQSIPIPTTQSQYGTISSNKLNPRQIQQLKIYFRQNQTPNNHNLVAIAAKIGANHDLVKRWFLQAYKEFCRASKKKRS